MATVTLSPIETLRKNYASYFLESIPKTPIGKYASILLLRETKSYAIFTTEGGQQQDIERTQAGLESSKPIDRLVMFKRKQVAPERRTGKALLRQYGILPFAVVERGDRTDVIYGAEAIAEAEKANKGKKEVKFTSVGDCYLTAGLCTRCPDCLTYGYAAIEGEGARKGRVMTDSCFSVRPYALIQKGMKFNVIDEKEQTSGTITEYDYTTPEVFLPSIVTTVDFTLDEFVYILSNLVRTTRYGKESSRQGFMRNHILAVAFSDVELFSNLEFTQAFYDAFEKDEKIDLVKGFLSKQKFIDHAPTVIQKLTEDLNGRLQIVTSTESIAAFKENSPRSWSVGLNEILSQVRELNQDESKLTSFLRNLNTQSASFSI